jgi:hypothetical protein
MFSHSIPNSIIRLAGIGFTTYWNGETISFMVRYLTISTSCTKSEEVNITIFYYKNTTCFYTKLQAILYYKNKYFLIILKNICTSRLNKRTWLTSHIMKSGLQHFLWRSNTTTAVLFYFWTFQPAILILNCLTYGLGGFQQTPQVYLNPWTKK